MDKRLLLQMIMTDDFQQQMHEDGRCSQILDQDLWVVGDRSREEGVPSRFGRGTGMCALIRLGNCGGRERGWELERRGQRLYENCFPVRNCSIVTALVSCFFFFKSLSLFLFVCVPCISTTEREVNIICAQRIRYGVFVSACGGGVVNVYFTNEEQLSNQSTLFRLAPLGSNRKYSQDFLSLSQALKQDTSAGYAY